MNNKYEFDVIDDNLGHKIVTSNHPYYPGDSKFSYLEPRPHGNREMLFILIGFVTLFGLILVL